MSHCVVFCFLGLVANGFPNSDSENRVSTGKLTTDSSYHKELEDEIRKKVAHTQHNNKKKIRTEKLETPEEQCCGSIVDDNAESDHTVRFSPMDLTVFLSNYAIIILGVVAAIILAVVFCCFKNKQNNRTPGIRQ